MISIDQVLLLQEKVESAVQKIVELKSENDALRSKCSELTNALSEKTELLNSFKADEEKIESSIKNAISRLDTLENNVITGGTTSAAKAPAKTAEVSNPTPAAAPAAENQTQSKPVSQPAQQNATPVEEQPAQTEQSSEETDDMDFSLDLSTDSPETDSEEANQPEEKFDIF